MGIPGGLTSTIHPESNHFSLPPLLPPWCKAHHLLLGLQWPPNWYIGFSPGPLWSVLNRAAKRILSTRTSSRIISLQDPPMVLKLTKSKSQNPCDDSQGFPDVVPYFLTDLVSCYSLPHSAPSCLTSLIVLEHAGHRGMTVMDGSSFRYLHGLLPANRAWLRCHLPNEAYYNHSI